MAKKNKHFIDGKILKENARLVQKYNRIVAYLGGDEDLMQKILKRIAEYKYLETIYNDWVEHPEKTAEIKAHIVSINKTKKFNFFERMLDGNENERNHFLRRLENNYAIEADYHKYKDLSKENKMKLLDSILNNPSYKSAKNVLGDAMVLMCDRWATQPSYCGYSPDRKDDMKSDACFYLLRGIEGFDCDRGSSIFAYFTETIKNCYNSYCSNRKRDAQNEVGLDFLDNIQAGFKWETYGVEE